MREEDLGGRKMAENKAITEKMERDKKGKEKKASSGVINKRIPKTNQGKMQEGIKGLYTEKKGELTRIRKWKRPGCMLRAGFQRAS
jgi:hypothetical protein